MGGDVSLATFLVSASVIAVAAGGIVGLLVYDGKRRRRLRDQEVAIAASLESRELAVMVEDVKTTRFGAFCIVMLVVNVFVTWLSYTSAQTVFQQIQIGVALIASTMLFGLGAALGRRRTYRIYRSKHRVE